MFDAVETPSVGRRVTTTPEDVHPITLEAVGCGSTPDHPARTTTRADHDGRREPYPRRLPSMPCRTLLKLWKP